MNRILIIRTEQARWIKFGEGKKSKEMKRNKKYWKFPRLNKIECFCQKREKKIGKQITSSFYVVVQKFASCHTTSFLATRGLTNI